jgi:hypothetical protein
VIKHKFKKSKSVLCINYPFIMIFFTTTTTANISVEFYGTKPYVATAGIHR